ncbi:hypothetical protein KVH02_34565 [Streptomyces olivaceus]|uniref:Uncharacterized protein n=1 Tax=Streptomyces olivaceus TaxID=47716 RepID=A0ABS7WF90_STROV|nr:hypothetical protein [Streptomyces olivaceus]MBZ6093390.1 hypothetical protein [Streptomyces olivaceus]MBZ6100740.1 hypothetical protein [Streptomyces olivaceus]MBZ6121838.1 hypothetical protein [Streptomyces olivaceus]MBZ6156223.1 hypothetical protein [Streptomyces olivaceus]MBZ6303118.1 hypothetical protein [Streptomyces olivaceus]
MKPAPSVLTTAFYAFYDLHRPAYHAYAAALLPQEEAQLSVTQLFDLIASNWTWIMTEQRPSAWAWNEHTRAVARRAGRTPAPAEDAALLHDELGLSIDRIATITGTDPARVTALLAAARRLPQPADLRTSSRPSAPDRMRDRGSRSDPAGEGERRPGRGGATAGRTIVEGPGDRERSPVSADAVAASTKAADAAPEYLSAARLEQLRERTAARTERSALWTQRLPGLAARPLDGDAGAVIA